MDEYLAEFGPEDAVVIEVSCGSFYWADRVEASAPLDQQVRLLITVSGITLLAAAAFIADVETVEPVSQ